jgi:hypothetical protein
VDKAVDFSGGLGSYLRRKLAILKDLSWLSPVFPDEFAEGTYLEI